MLDMGFVHDVRAIVAKRACLSRFPRMATLMLFGKGWKCERGFVKAGADCVAVKIPANAHLDSAGNDWSCDRPFRRRTDTCVLPE